MRWAGIICAAAMAAAVAACGPALSPDERDWADARAENSCESYTRYAESQPGGAHIGGAGAFMDVRCVRHAQIGRDFRTLTHGPERWNADYASENCEDTFAPVPVGWHIASSARTRTVARVANFGVHVFVADDGQGWNALAYSTPGERYGGDLLGYEGGNVRATSCTMVVLLERDGVESLPIVDVNGAEVQSGPGYARVGQDYRTLTLGPEAWSRHRDDSRTCEDSLASVPAGWHIANSARTQAVARVASFHTDVLVSADGSSWWAVGPNASEPGAAWESGELIREGGQVRVNECALVVLLERDGVERLPIQDASGNVIYSP